MKEFFDKEGKKVKIGDVLSVKISLFDEVFGYLKGIEFIPVTEDNVNDLIKAKILTSTTNNDDISMTCIIERLSNKFNKSIDDTRTFISELYSVNKSSALSLVLKEIALKLDEKYPDHISNVDEFYILSIFDGVLHKVYKSQIKTFNNFAAFRTLEDGKIACKIIRSWLKNMFKDNVK